MYKPELISNPDELTPEWLTRVLNHGGVKGRVDQFTAASIGTGQVGENVRFTLEGSGNIPGSVVGKFVSTDPTSKQTGVMLQTYLREVFFYNELNSTVDIQTPNVYYAEIEKDTHDFAIIMEDLSPGVQGDQIAGCTVDQAALALEELAKLHGPRWGDADLGKYALLAPSVEVESENQTQTIYQMVQEGFLERYANKLSETQARLVLETGDRLLAYSSNEALPDTLIHIDYRLDNMMFGGPYPLAIVDWQSINRGCALNDVSYCLGTSLDPDIRSNNERELLAHYLDVLKSYKVELKWDDCWLQYRHYAPAGLIMAVIASMIVGETERGNDMFMAMARRSASMSDELESMKVLSSSV